MIYIDMVTFLTINLFVSGGGGGGGGEIIVCIIQTYCLGQSFVMRILLSSYLSSISFALYISINMTTAE